MVEEASTRRHAALWGVAALSVVVGFFGSSLGFFMLLGPLLLVLGLVVSRRRGRVSSLVAIGAGFVVGTACYIGLGLVQPDGPGRCSGSSTGEIVCEGP